MGMTLRLLQGFGIALFLGPFAAYAVEPLCPGGSSPRPDICACWDFDSLEHCATGNEGTSDLTKAIWRLVKEYTDVNFGGPGHRSVPCHCGTGKPATTAAVYLRTVM
jgi:hypothetical protein